MVLWVFSLLTTTGIDNIKKENKTYSTNHTVFLPPVKSNLKKLTESQREGSVTFLVQPGFKVGDKTEILGH